MKQVDNRWLACRLLLLMVVHITMEEQVTSKPTDRNSTMLLYHCSMYTRINEKYFRSNLNITLSSLRSQLATSGYATSHTLRNGESVWASSWCMGYLSVRDCLGCFDYGVEQLKRCGISNGAQVSYLDCDTRYENYNFFSETINGTGLIRCDNITASQPREFRKEAERLLLDLPIAASRAANFYAASTRKIAVDNATVYAIAQCNINLSQSDCLECLKSRSRSLYDCLPSTSAQATFELTLNHGCFMRYSTTPFFGQNQTTDIASLLWDANSRKKRYIIGIVVGGVSFLLLVLAIFLRCGKWKRTYRGHQADVTVGPGVLKAKVYYNHKHLELATNNFGEENVIGNGGFGKVYKATFDDNKVVAVKKLKVGYAGAQLGFENEILLISQIHHRNLLGLLGWSSEGCNLLLVLEYMPNGSLDKFLWGEKKGALNWKTRQDIILGIARGLTHLHKEFHVRIVHRDIKSSNILLDGDFQPKIADFGLARFQPEDQSHITTMFAGTLGYTAPEYVLYGHLSDKVDTFSFGIVILEIVSGRKCTYRNFDASSNDCLLEYAWKLYETKNFMKLVDETMDLNQYEEEHVTSIIKIALLCTQSPVSKRPTMSEVVLLLQNDPSLKERRLTKPNFIDHDWMIQIGS